MKERVTLENIAYASNLFNERRKHKDMIYSCDFVVCKII